MEALKNDFSRGNILPVYIFCGDDEYTKKTLEEGLEKEINSRYGNCECIILDGKECSPSQIIDEVQGSSLFSKNKLLIIKNGDEVLSKTDFKNFISEFGRKKETDCVIVVESDKKYINGLTYKIQVPYENRLPRWIKQKFNSKNKEIADDAANLLLFYCGRNLFNIVNEIEKIITAYPEKDTYSLKEVGNIVGAHKKYDIFGYLDALVSDDEKKAVTLLENLLKYGAEPLKIVGMLRWRIQQMIAIRALMIKGMSESEIIKTMGINYYTNRGICRKMQKYSIQRLLDNYDSLYKLDLRIKTTSINQSFLLERFSLSFLAG